MGPKAKCVNVKMPVEIDVLKKDLKDFRDPKKGKFTRLLLLHKGLTVDAFLWTPAAITGHEMLQEGWSYKLDGFIVQEPKTKKKDKFSNSTAKFKWIFKNVKVLSEKRKDKVLITLDAIAEMLQKSKPLAVHHLENVTLENAEIYRYIGCKSCKIKRPERSKTCSLCKKRGLHPDSKKLCMILRNVTIKDSSGTLHDLVVFNDECEKFLEKSAGDFQFDEEAQLLLEKIVGTSINAKISSHPARNKQYGQSIHLQDIKIVKNASNNREFNTAIYEPDRINGGGDDFVIVDSPCLDDVITKFEAASISVKELPKRLNIGTYELHSKPAGHVLIVNNINFRVESQKRVGSEIDERSLQEVFERLDFEVFCERDLNAEQFQCRVKNFKKRLIHCKISACAVVVMSHGRLNEVEMVDGETINIWSDIVSQFHDSNFPEFTNKPKIFIFESCQIFNENPSLLQNGALPQYNDMILCFPAIPGHFSYRNKTEGAFFIKLLCHIFKQFAAALDLVEMLNLIQSLMKSSRFIAKKRGNQRMEKVQMCYHIGLGFEPFRFKPVDA